MAIITISRGSFAGGMAIADKLGKRLDHPVLGREEVLNDTVREFGIDESELIPALNESPPFWRQVPGKRLAYVKCVTAALLDHARDGKLVYHGNVGHLLLAGIQHVVRVRILADHEFRVAAAVEKTGLPRSKAEAYIQGVDTDRQRWARLLYGVDAEDPTQYDVTLNLEHVGVDGAVDTIAGMTQLEGFQPTPESRKRYDDMVLACRVWTALARDPKTRSSGIDVTADDGKIRIVGSVLTGEATDLVPQIAEQVEGVTSVQSEAGVGTNWYW